MDVPAIRYARTADGLNIAYQVVGEGPFDLVFVPHVISNVEIFWENPRWAGFMRELASFSRLLLFDRRGVGLSDRPRSVPPLEQRMDDVRAVLDAVGSERAALFGTGPDGAMAVLFAATYPERVTALVLFAVPPRRIWAPDYAWGLREDEARHYVEEGESRFVEPDYMAQLGERLYPSIAADEEAIAWSIRATRLSATPATFAALRQMNLEIDIRNVLPTIRVPTLVLHRTGDRYVPVDVSRFVAEQIPGALFQELDGIDHIPWVGDADALVAAVREFVKRVAREAVGTNRTRPRPRHRSLHGHRRLDREGSNARRCALERAPARAPLTRARAARSFPRPRDRHGRRRLLCELRRARTRHPLRRRGPRRGGGARHRDQSRLARWRV
jgi:pimeloyl-ACP methyl ester carboxylesterase